MRGRTILKSHNQVHPGAQDCSTEMVALGRQDECGNVDYHIAVGRHPRQGWKWI